MTHRFAVALTAAVALVGLGAATARAQEALEPKHESWTFSGPFGTFDKGQLQRGFAVYKAVCSNCHSLERVAIRSLGEAGGLGYSAAQVKALAATYKVSDGPDKTGQMFDRPGLPSDHFPKPFPNPEAAQAALGAAPPDLSVIVKARSFEEGFPRFLADPFTQYNEQGQDYVYSILTGFGEKPPKGEEPPRPGLNYNPYFPSHWIAMPPPLSDGLVPYTDGAPQTVDQYAKDVVSFLTWAAEPHMEARKRMGFQAIIFLIALAALLYFTKHRVWAADPNRT
jgi:ubiquinol-cytochrome c reductase cytochrome b/c1 subunit